MAISVTDAGLAFACWSAAAQDVDELSSKCTIPQAWEMIPAAISKLCRWAVAGSEWHRLQNSLSIGVSAGVGTVPDSAFVETLKPKFGGRVLLQGISFPAEYYEEFSHLLLPRPGGRAGYHVTGGNGSGGVVEVYLASGLPYTGNVSLWICQYQTIANLSTTFPPNLEGELRNILTNMIKAKATGQALEI